MDSAEIARVAAGLTKAKKRVIFAAPEGWFAASHLTSRLAASAGSVLTILARAGLFERRSDPKVWGRSQYRLTADGLAIRALLSEEGK